MIGGSQERKRRGGTLNVPGIVGLGRALELAVDEMEQNTKHIHHLQQQLYRGIVEKFPGLIHLNSDPINGMYNIVNISIDAGPDRAIDGEMLLLNLDIEGIACSNGSACSSGAVEPSHVLKAIGLDPKVAGASLRFSLGKDNTEEDITYTLDRLEAILDRMLKTT
jgi:cysteine desulfurase